ncbi:hypothetical protein VP01_28g5 [Puccinia sorghi]|uniref:Uncharacterized protein n=1 Tax=Puccinia sorghi TaxID=27349 RepID=A0A0L6V1I9_9BASI|nr:hypothetical protein VP01_28g5 [Puccinia sorghi]
MEKGQIKIDNVLHGLIHLSMNAVIRGNKKQSTREFCGGIDDVGKWLLQQGIFDYLLGNRTRLYSRVGECQLASGQAFPGSHTDWTNPPTSVPYKKACLLDLHCAGFFFLFLFFFATSSQRTARFPMAHYRPRCSKLIIFFKKSPRRLWYRPLDYLIRKQLPKIMRICFFRFEIQICLYIFLFLIPIAIFTHENTIILRDSGKPIKKASIVNEIFEGGHQKCKIYLFHEHACLWSPWQSHHLAISHNENAILIFFFECREWLTMIRRMKSFQHSHSSAQQDSCHDCRKSSLPVVGSIVFITARSIPFSYQKEFPNARQLNYQYLTLLVANYNLREWINVNHLKPSILIDVGVFSLPAEGNCELIIKVESESLFRFSWMNLLNLCSHKLIFKSIEDSSLTYWKRWRKIPLFHILIGSLSSIVGILVKLKVHTITRFEILLDNGGLNQRPPLFVTLQTIFLIPTSFSTDSVLALGMVVSNLSFLLLEFLHKSEIRTATTFIDSICMNFFFSLQEMFLVAGLFSQNAPGALRAPFSSSVFSALVLNLILLQLYTMYLRFGKHVQHAMAYLYFHGEVLNHPGREPHEKKPLIASLRLQQTMHGSNALKIYSLAGDWGARIILTALFVGLKGALCVIPRWRSMTRQNIHVQARILLTLDSSHWIDPLHTRPSASPNKSGFDIRMTNHRPGDAVFLECTCRLKPYKEYKKGVVWLSGIWGDRLDCVSDGPGYLGGRCFLVLTPTSFPPDQQLHSFLFLHLDFLIPFPRPPPQYSRLLDRSFSAAIILRRLRSELLDFHSTHILALNTDEFSSRLWLVLMVECLSPDLLRLPEAFNDVRDKRKAMSLADVNEKNMIHLVADDPVLRTLLLTADSTISSILSHLSLLRINSGISEFFQFSWLLSLLEVTSTNSAISSPRLKLPSLIVAMKLPNQSTSSRYASRLEPGRPKVPNWSSGRISSAPLIKPFSLSSLSFIALAAWPVWGSLDPPRERGDGVGPKAVAWLFSGSASDRLPAVALLPLSLQIISSLASMSSVLTSFILKLCAKDSEHAGISMVLHHRLQLALILPQRVVRLELGVVFQSQKQRDGLSYISSHPQASGRPRSHVADRLTRIISLENIITYWSWQAIASRHDLRSFYQCHHEYYEYFLSAFFFLLIHIYRYHRYATITSGDPRNVFYAFFLLLQKESQVSQKLAEYEATWGPARVEPIIPPPLRASCLLRNPRHPIGFGSVCGRSRVGAWTGDPSGGQACGCGCCAGPRVVTKRREHGRDSSPPAIESRSISSQVPLCPWTRPYRPGAIRWTMSAKAGSIFCALRFVVSAYKDRRQWRPSAPVSSWWGLLSLQPHHCQPIFPPSVATCGKQNDIIYINSSTSISPLFSSRIHSLNVIMLVVAAEHYIKAAICPPHESIKAGIIQRRFLHIGPYPSDDAIARVFFRYKTLHILSALPSTSHNCNHIQYFTSSPSNFSVLVRHHYSSHLFIPIGTIEIFFTYIVICLLQENNMTQCKPEEQARNEQPMRRGKKAYQAPLPLFFLSCPNNQKDDESGEKTPSGGRDRGQTFSQQKTTPPTRDSEYPPIFFFNNILFQLKPDKTFNDVRDKRKAMNMVDVNGRNMIWLARPRANEISRIMESIPKLAQPIPRNAGATNGASHRCHARRPSGLSKLQLLFLLDCRPIILAQTNSKENNPQPNRDAGRAPNGNHRNAAAPPDRVRIPLPARRKFLEEFMLIMYSPLDITAGPIYTYAGHKSGSYFSPPLYPPPAKQTVSRNWRDFSILNRNVSFSLYIIFMKNYGENLGRVALHTRHVVWSPSSIHKCTATALNREKSKSYTVDFPPGILFPFGLISLAFTWDLSQRNAESKRNSEIYSLPAMTQLMWLFFSDQLHHRQSSGKSRSLSFFFFPNNCSSADDFYLVQKDKPSFISNSSTSQSGRHPPDTAPVRLKNCSAHSHSVPLRPCPQLLQLVTFCHSSLSVDNHDNQISFQIGRLFFMLSETTPPEMYPPHWAALLVLRGWIQARPMLANVGASDAGSPMMACNPQAPSMPPESLSRGFNPQARVYNSPLASRPFHHSYPSWFNPASSLSGSFGLGGYVGESQYPRRPGVNNFNPVLLGAYGSMPCSPSGGMKRLEAQFRGLSFETRTPAASSNTSSPHVDPSFPRRKPPAPGHSEKTDPTDVYVLCRMICATVITLSHPPVFSCSLRTMPAGRSAAIFLLTPTLNNLSLIVHLELTILHPSLFLFPSTAQQYPILTLNPNKQDPEANPKQHRNPPTLNESSSPQQLLVFSPHDYSPKSGKRLVSNLVKNINHPKVTPPKRFPVYILPQFHYQLSNRLVLISKTNPLSGSTVLFLSFLRLILNSLCCVLRISLSLLSPIHSQCRCVSLIRLSQKRHFLPIQGFIQLGCQHIKFQPFSEIYTTVHVLSIKDVNFGGSPRLPMEKEIKYMLGLAGPGLFAEFQLCCASLCFPLFYPLILFACQSQGIMTCDPVHPITHIQNHPGFGGFTWVIHITKKIKTEAKIKQTYVIELESDKGSDNESNLPPTPSKCSWIWNHFHNLKDRNGAVSQHKPTWQNISSPQKSLSFRFIQSLIARNVSNLDSRNNIPLAKRVFGIFIIRKSAKKMDKK